MQCSNLRTVNFEMGMCQCCRKDLYMILVLDHAGLNTHIIVSDDRKMENQSSFLKAVSVIQKFKKFKKKKKKKIFILKHNKTFGRNIHLLWSMNMIFGRLLLSCISYHQRENPK
ncbi:hypothetical protein SO802_002051 [Lithocarpus litseifolius]|uniref:Uncharacterized protein n=1 Tax=Lithocarpus litseifolius TaxID=425828 RepID=A0AAW2DWN9_9ROSI